jgi:NADH-quinone oxidoreductase subunit K
MTTPNDYIIVSGLLFTIGLFGVVANRKNIISYILSLEIMFLAINLLMLTGAKMHANVAGHGMVIFILAVTAAEVAIILGLVISQYKTADKISIESIETISE